MAIVMTNYTKLIGLTEMMDISGSTDLALGLFSNSTDIDCNASDMGLTEVSIAGYARITLPHGNWGSASTGCVVSETYNTPQTFTLTASGVVYGWFLYSSTQGRTIVAGFFDSAPLNFDSGGGTVTITPKISIGDCS